MCLELKGALGISKNSKDCEFIDIGAELSRELFQRYLEDFDGEYNSAINFDALVMEQADVSLRSSSN